ncbi:hypothetical protein [Novosphingobium percolationis]|uniref:hypothetical protein n=1 Tax=Novosphingobium percolationis TaxID=2871811 RepID=UPI001CD407D2|nr:hypothetical protein [Novosphingobium percolationis]
MDLNHLLFQHQVAVLRASTPRVGNAPARFDRARFDLVRHYKSRIDRLRRNLGASAYPDWCAMPVGDPA